MAVGYSLWFTLIIVITFFLYAGYTTAMTERRVVRQRRVNEIDSHVSGRMVDSLLNYETVKTYTREAYERQRYGRCMRSMPTTRRCRRATATTTPRRRWPRCAS